jgi:hypothetical protein
MGGGSVVVALKSNLRRPSPPSSPRPRTSQISQERWWTSDLRRLRLHGLIERIPRIHRYRVTTFGLRTAILLTLTYNRLLRPATAQALSPPGDAADSPIRRDLKRIETTLDRLASQAA